MNDDLEMLDRYKLLEPPMPEDSPFPQPQVMGGYPMDAGEEQVVSEVLAQAEQELRDLEARAQLQGQPPKTFSVSLLGWAEKCMLAMKMNRDINVGSQETALGHQTHEVLAALDFKAQMEGREQFRQDEALRVADRVLLRAEEAGGQPLARDGYFRLMEMVAKWTLATRFTCNADVWQVELPLRHEMAGRPVTGRVDKLVIVGDVAKITDYKTGASLPSQQTVDKRTQLPIYAWQVKQEYPWVRYFQGEELYVRYGVSRPVYLDEWDVERVEQYLVIQLERVAKAFTDETFKPTPGSWCSYCPAATECPLPKSRRLAAEDTDTQELADELIVLDAQRTEVTDALKAKLDKETRGSVTAGDQDVGWHPKTKKVQNKKALGQVLYNLDDYYETKESVEFGKRKIQEDR